MRNERLKWEVRSEEITLQNILFQYHTSHFTLLTSISRVQNKGFTLIEIIVGLAIFLIVVGALFGMTQLIFENIGQTRVRHAGRLLANEKMEEAHNLSYDSLGTQGGIPAGPLAPQQQVELGGLTFTVKTAVIFIDDPFDGTAPADPLSTDYKRVRIEVSWGGGFGSGSRPVVLVSDVAPEGIESAAGGGTLSLLVFDGQGEPFFGADVHIVNSQVLPPVDLNTTSDTFGRVLLPGAPASIESYEVTVTKTGYSTDRTYSRSEVANPTKPHLSIIEGDVTEASFAIDKVSTLTVNTFGNRTSGFPSLPNIEFRLHGEKIIGTDVEENEIYKYDEILQTDSSGQIILENMEWDSYRITVTEPSRNLAGSSPSLPFSLLPDTQVSLALALEPASNNSLLVLVTNPQEDPLASASAHLVHEGTAYDETVLTGDPTDPDFGHAYFGGLNTLQYSLTVSLTGYEEATASVQIDGEVFENIILNEL